MKRTFLHIVFSLLLSAMFLFAGTGYNLIHYCCNDCETVGIEMAAEMSCESIHHHHYEKEQHHTLNADVCATCVNNLAKGCDIDRLTVDVPSVQLTNQTLTDYSLIFVELNDFQTLLLSSSGFTEETEPSHTPPDIPAPLKGRQILSRKSVLII